MHAWDFLFCQSLVFAGLKDTPYQEYGRRQFRDIGGGTWAYFRLALVFVAQNSGGGGGGGAA